MLRFVNEKVIPHFSREDLGNGKLTGWETRKSSDSELMEDGSTDSSKTFNFGPSCRKRDRSQDGSRNHYCQLNKWNHC